MESSITQPQPVWVHPSQQMQSIAQRRRQALSEGCIPNAFLYSGYAQSRLWLEVFGQHSPTSYNNDFQEWYKNFLTSVAQNVTADKVHVVGLGSGGGEKDSWLLEALHGRQLLFTPADVSEVLALLSAQRVAHLLTEPPRPLVAELSDCSDLPIWLDSFDKGVQRVFTCFGVIPNLEPTVLLPFLHSLLREGDILLLSANLAPATEKQNFLQACQHILPQYDNAETHRWVSQVLVDWGLSGYLEPLECRLKPWENLYQVTMNTCWHRATNLTWEGQQFEAQAGQELRVFSSLRYTPALLEDWLAKFSLRPDQSTLFSSREEGIWEVSKK